MKKKRKFLSLLMAMVLMMGAFGLIGCVNYGGEDVDESKTQLKIYQKKSNSNNL